MPINEGATLTPAQLQQIYEYFQSPDRSFDFDPTLIAPSTDEEWRKVLAIVMDKRNPADPKSCSIDIKAVLDAYYGRDVHTLLTSVEDAEKRITGPNSAESRINEVETRLTGPDGAEERVNQKASDVASAEKRISGMESSASASAEAAARNAGIVGGVKDEALLIQTAVNEDKQAVEIMKADVERIYQDASEGGIYGVDFNMVTGAANRIDAAVGLEFHRFIGGAGSTPIPSAKSFMQIGPWAQIYQTLRTVEGNSLVARTGDANFETALRSGECNLFTCIPKYYIKMETPVVNGQSHWIIHVSAKPFAGAFSVIEGDSVEIASIVTGKKDGKHVSQPGVIPLVSTNAYTFENTAEQQGLYNSSWNDFLAWWILMLVQTANLNSQRSVGYGCASTLASWGGDAIKVVEARTSSNEIVMSKWGNYAPGLTVYINSAASSWYGGGLGIRTVTSVAPHPSNAGWVVLTVDGDPLTTAVGDWCSGCAQITDIEAVLDMGLNPGYWKASPNAPESICHAFVYGICDPWANIFQATSGMCKKADKLYVASGRQKQPSDVPCANWNEADDFVWLGEGWPKSWRIQQSANSITMVPTSLGGNDGTLFGDYLWGAADSIRIPWRSGNFYDGSNGGACSVYWYTAGNSYFSDGARLTYQKKK